MWSSASAFFSSASNSFHCFEPGGLLSLASRQALLSRTTIGPSCLAPVANAQFMSPSEANKERVNVVETRPTVHATSGSSGTRAKSGIRVTAGRARIQGLRNQGCSCKEVLTGCPPCPCAVTRRRFPVGANPTRQPLQPEATGAAMEVTKWLKPSDSVSRYTVTARVCRP